MSWQLHGAVEQEILCIRQQEISKTDEFVAQIAVRFTADQVRSAFVLGEGRS